MARANVIPNGQDFVFTPDDGQPLRLHGSLGSYTDKIKIRLASHNFLKRDGGEQEPMGSDPGRFSFRITFLSDNPGAAYRQVVQAVRNQPRGLLTHPLLGDIRCACEGIDLAHDIGGSYNAPDATINFVEDALDSSITADQATSPNSAAAQVDTWTAALTSAINAAPDVAAVASGACSALVAAATAYTTAALSAWQTSTPDASLATKLTAVADASRTAQTAALSGTVGNEADRFTVLSGIDGTLSGCLALDSAIASVKPLMVSYVVPGLCNIGVLAAQLYGSDGTSQIETILTMNRIPNPQAIRTGTVLLVQSPTV